MSLLPPFRSGLANRNAMYGTRIAHAVQPLPYNPCDPHAAIYVPSHHQRCTPQFYAVHVAL